MKNLKRIRAFNKVTDAKKFVRDILRQKLKEKVKKLKISKENILKNTRDEFYAEMGKRTIHLVIDNDSDNREVTFRLSQLKGIYYETLKFYRIRQTEKGKWIVYEEKGYKF